MNIDLSKKNAAVSILFTLTLIFFGVAILLELGPHSKDLGRDVWTVFNGSWSALLLILNSEARKDAGLPAPPSTPPSIPNVPDTPAQPKQ